MKHELNLRDHFEAALDRMASETPTDKEAILLNIVEGRLSPVVEQIASEDKASRLAAFEAAEDGATKAEIVASAVSLRVSKTSVLKG